MTSSRQLPSLQSIAFRLLTKSQTEYLKTNGFFSTDIYSIKSDTLNHIKAASEIAQRATFAIFLQAVIDNDISIVKKCLDAEPELLIVAPDPTLVIESKCTWQKFYAESALKMAAKRKQIKMIKLLLSYYYNLTQTDELISAKIDALSAWKPYETGKKYANGDDKIIIRKEYADYAQSLIDVFKDETFPNGVMDWKSSGALNVVLSERTEFALLSLLNILMPKSAAKLDNHIDVELLLLAVYKAYWKNFSTFNNNNKKMSLLIRLVGLIQSVLTPETGEIFCEGLDGVVEAMKAGNEKEIRPAAAVHKMLSGEDFYRSSRDSRSGSGIEYFCGKDGVPSTRSGCSTVDTCGAYYPLMAFEELCLEKEQSFSKCYSTMLSPTLPAPKK